MAARKVVVLRVSRKKTYNYAITVRVLSVVKRKECHHAASTY